MIPRPTRVIDLTGQRFGRLLVMEYAGQNEWMSAIWKVRCDCGWVGIKAAGNLKSGMSKRCSRLCPLGQVIQEGC